MQYCTKLNIDPQHIKIKSSILKENDIVISSFFAQESDYRSDYRAYLYTINL